MIVKMYSIKVLVIFIITFVTHSHSSKALRILGVFPVPGKSHFMMGEEIFKSLALKGHKIDVVSHFPQKKPFPNYTDISLKGLTYSGVNNVSVAKTQEFDGIKTFVEEVGITACELLGSSPIQKLLEKPKNSYDVIIVELFAAHCFLTLGSHFNVPMVGVVTTKLHDWLYAPFGNPMNTAYLGSVTSGFDQEMTFFERLKNTYIHNYVTFMFHYHVEAECEQVEKYMGRKISSIQDLYNDVSIVLVNSHYSLNDIKPSTPDIIEVGGIHVSPTGQELTPDLKKWLDDSEEGCIYISFGSMVRIETLPADKLEAFYEMFRRIAPVRVLMKVADPKSLPPNLPKNVKTSSWLPQVAVLKHENVKAFVTHGGLMGTQESIAWGVPLIGIPIFGDQYTNINSYVNKKVAVALDLKSFDADKLTNAVHTVIKNPDYRNNVKKMGELFMDRPMSPKDTAVYWIEYAARHGNRLKSPALKLAWYQYHLLDVYGFVLGCLLLTIFIVKKFLGFIYSFFFSRKSRATKSTPTSLKSKKTK